MMKTAWGGARVAPHDGAEISFSDDGKGIPEEIAEYLFDPFFTTKESSSGSGFGLYNSKLLSKITMGKLGFPQKITAVLLFIYSYLWLILMKRRPG